MEFRVIGPVELRAGGRRRDLGTTKERCVLAVLLLAQRQPVPAEALIARVWDVAPAKARQSLYVYITRLRGRLEDLDGVELRGRQGGYLLDVADEAVDLHRFRLLRDQARAIAASGDGEYALEHYRRAARLWQAAPLADLGGDWAERTRTGLREELLTATFERAELELHHGHHADLVRELTGLAERNPYNERPVELLMVALFRSGRQAEALDAYRRTRDRLAREVGTEPTPGLQRLHQRILRTDPELLRVPGTRLAADRPRDNLPPDQRLFTGRDDELGQLLAAVPGLDGPEPAPASAGGAATVLTIDGMPGVGKTALAVHLAHRLAGRFPDGRYYLDLRAHDPVRRPLDPAAALDALLRMIGVPAGRIPRSPDERAALWRSRLAGGRAIVVLDDAAGHDQVEPLLPASAGCLVVVTSRRRLTGLRGAHPLPLDVLPARDAITLFTRQAGTGRAADGAAVAAVVDRCGHLPLAVLMAASRLRHRRAWDVADLLDRLTSDERRLEELRDDGSEISVVFEVSYRGLPAALRQAFRTLALHPGPDLTAHSAAALLGRPPREGERVLDELLDRHLITEPVGGRYRMHELVRDFARRLAGAEDSAADRRRALRRLLDSYVEAAARADLLTGGRPASVPGAPPALPPGPPGTEAEARRWLAAEHECLLAAARHAVRLGHPGHVGRLARALARHLDASGHWDAAAALHERAVAAWRELDDPAGTARALHDLSHIRFRCGEYDAALEDAGRALAIFRAAGERAREADVLAHMSLVHWHRSRFPEALARCREALDIFRALGDRRGEASSLDHAAIFLEFTGEYAEAERLRTRALAVFTELGDAPGRTMALNNMGDLALRRGEVDLAVRCYERTAAAASALGRQHRAICLINMANVHRYTGAPEAALENYRKALAEFMEIGDRRTEIETLLGIGATFQRMGRWGEALIHHQKALAIARAIDERYEQAVALRRIGEALAGSGRRPAAVEHFRRARDLAEAIGVPHEIAKALAGLGAALPRVPGGAQTGGESAAECLRRALLIFERIGAPAEAEALRPRLRDTGDATGS